MFVSHGTLRTIRTNAHLHTYSHLHTFPDRKRRKSNHKTTTRRVTLAKNELTKVVHDEKQKEATQKWDIEGVQEIIYKCFFSSLFLFFLLLVDFISTPTHCFADDGNSKPFKIVVVVVVFKKAPTR